MRRATVIMKFVPVKVTCPDAPGTSVWDRKMPAERWECPMSGRCRGSEGLT